MKFPWLSRSDQPSPRRTARPAVELLETRNLLASVLLSNGIPAGTVGQFDVLIAEGGNVLEGRVTAQGNSILVNNENVIFDFTNYVDVGSDGGGIELGTTTITRPTTLGTDGVTSAGQFLGQNGLINWTVRSFFQPGTSMLVQVLTFTSDSPDKPLGNLRLINYLDEDVASPGDDILYLVGTPGQLGFQAFTLDNQQRVGFSQSGVYAADGNGLINARYDGFAADAFPQLRDAITGAGANYSIAGNIDTADLPAFNDPFLGTVFGPADVTTAFAWSVDPNATTATISTFAQLLPTAITPAPPPSVDENEAFLRQLYRDLLGRAPDEAGLAFSLDNLRSGRKTRDQVAADFLTSREFFGIEVDKFYLRFLDRQADPAGRQFFINKLVSGASEADVIVLIATSQEYLSRFGRTNESFVRQLYVDILERQGEPAGVSAHVQALNLGIFTKEQIVGNFLASDEAYKGAIEFYFCCLLRQTPEPAEVRELFDILNLGIFDPREAKALVLGSEDYLDVALQLNGNSKSAVVDGIGPDFTICLERLDSAMSPHSPFSP